MAYSAHGSRRDAADARLDDRATGAPGRVGKRTLVDAIDFGPAVGGAAVQRRDAAGAAAGDPEAVKAAAAHGTSGVASALPYLDRIQPLFGRHDVSAVRAHVGGAAAEGAAAMGAVAFASGDQVAFGAAPDLHTAAHEAAHVVQQRGGVQLAGGVGAAGDPYERHADAVADAVVAGRSAEALLDQEAPATQGAPQGRAVQRKNGIQRSAAYGKNPHLDRVSRLIHKAAGQTPALKELMAFLNSDDNGTFVELDTFEEENSGRFGKTNVLVEIDDAFHRIDQLDDEELAKVKPKSGVMIRVMVNVAKIGKPLGGGGSDDTVGINEVLNTLAHELTLHGAKFKAIGEAIRGGTSGSKLGEFLTRQCEKGQAFDHELAHMQLLTGTSPEYEGIQATIVGLIKQAPEGGLDADRYQRDMVRDRAAQAMEVHLAKLEGDARVLHAHIVEQLQKAKGGQAVDYPELIKVIEAYFTKVKTWSDVQDQLPKQYPLLKDVAALTYFGAKYDQLADQRRQVMQLMQEDMERRKQK